MARIKGKDIYLKNDDQIYFGDSNEAALWYENNDLLLNHTISGIDPTECAKIASDEIIVGILCPSIREPDRLLDDSAK